MTRGALQAARDTLRAAGNRFHDGDSGGYDEHNSLATLPYPTHLKPPMPPVSTPPHPPRRLVVPFKPPGQTHFMPQTPGSAIWPGGVYDEQNRLPPLPYPSQSPITTRLKTPPPHLPRRLVTTVPCNPRWTPSMPQTTGSTMGPAAGMTSKTACRACTGSSWLTAACLAPSTCFCTA